jgi:hypothetical protein
MLLRIIIVIVIIIILAPSLTIGGNAASQTEHSCAFTSQSPRRDPGGTTLGSTAATWIQQARGRNGDMPVVRFISSPSSVAPGQALACTLDSHLHLYWMVPTGGQTKLSPSTLVPFRRQGPGCKIGSRGLACCTDHFEGCGRAAHTCTLARMYILVHTLPTSAGLPLDDDY